MDNAMLISVVIPVYNAEKNLRRAVDSILAQMNDRIELVLVDDGSTDGSGAICDEYAKSNPGVRVVHKQNGGPCTARNAGMKTATGEYFVFLDSDDYLAPNTMEELEKVICEHHPDLIDFGWNYVNNVGEIVPNLHKVPKNVLLDNGFIRTYVLPPLLHLHGDAQEYFVYDFACTKVFRRRIIVENGVYFDEGRRTWEDRPFVCQYLKHCRNFYSMDRCLYYYVFVEGSLSQRYTPDFFRIIRVTFEFYRDVFGDEFEFDTPYINEYWCRAIENMVFRSLEQTENRDVIRDTIISTLSEKQVIYWYSKRPPKDAFEEKINERVVAGDPKAALRLYEKKAAQKKREKMWLYGIGRVKGVIRKLIRR